MGTGQPSPQRKHTQPPDGPVPRGKARPCQAEGQRCQHPQTSLGAALSLQHRPGLAQGCRTVLLRGSKPWLGSPGMHCLGQGESGGQTPTGVEGGTGLGGHCPILLQLQSSPTALTLARSEGAGAGKGFLPDHNAYIGKEGGKGEEEEYIPSRTVNHAE